MASHRGRRLVSTKDETERRQPEFLSFFNFGLAVCLNSRIFVLWAALLHPVSHYLVRSEKRLMIDLFGEAYREYQKTAGRFLPGSGPARVAEAPSARLG